MRAMGRLAFAGALLALGMALGGASAPPPAPADTSGFVSNGVVQKRLKALASNTIYSAGAVSYATGIYTAAAGPQPIPGALAAGQVYFVNFPATNPGAASLVIGSLPTKPIKVLDSSGAALTLAGGEIVPGPATVYYDGTEYIYSGPGSRSIGVASPTTLTQANFVNRDTFYLPSGAQTLTLPCSSTLSPNGQASVFSASGTVTLTVTGGCSPSDAITRNGVSAASQTILQGEPLAIVTTDGAGHFYVTGSSYIGPGDLATYTAWYGLSAFSNAYRGNRLVYACNSTGGVDVGCADLFSNPVSGLIVPATIAGITCPGPNCTVQTWYDPISGNNATQATVAKRATLTANCIGSLPCATFTRASSQCYLGSSTITLAQPYTMVIAAKRTGSFTSFGTVLSDGSDSMEIGFRNAASTMYIAISSAIAIVSGGTPDSAWHVLQGIFNTASSSGTIDGVTTSISSPGSGGFTGVPVIGDDGDGSGGCGNDGGYFDGQFVGGGYAAGAFAPSTLAATNSTIHARWGF